MAKKKLPPLDSLHAFDAAARLGGFTRAAEELNVTHGAVSRRIAQLESDLNVKLFERRNRAVFLTPDGVILAEAMAGALRLLHEAIGQIGEPITQRPLVFSCERTLATRWLIPRLHNFDEFENHEPRVRLHMLNGWRLSRF